MSSPSQDDPREPSAPESPEDGATPAAQAPAPDDTGKDPAITTVRRQGTARKSRSKATATAVIATTQPRQASVTQTIRPSTGGTTGRSTSPGETIAERVGLPGMKTPLALLSLPGERSFDRDKATRDGGYLLGEVLGEGGMGRVVAARDAEMGRIIALKTLRDDLLDDAKLVRALLFEARITGQLEHPHIVPVYDVGTLGDGRVYYTMKLVGDLSLRDVLRQLRDGNTFAHRTYTLPRLLQYFRGICMAMDYAHARGVIHRDLKPDNVLIGDYGEVQIMDWGIARVLPRGADEPGWFAGAPEEPGVIAGTPHYMSPEQARGETEDVDARSDIFSLGILLYQILSFQLPFDTTTTDEQIDALLNRTPPLPSERAPEREIPEALERICMRALSPDRDDRYPSARTFWNDIEAFLEGRKEEERLAQLADDQAVIAKKAADRFFALSAQVASEEAVVREDAIRSSVFDPLPTRQAAWQRRLATEQLRLQEARALAEAVAGFNQALAYNPGHEGARQGLRDIYRRKSHDALGNADHASGVLYAELAENLQTRAAPGESSETTTLLIRSYPAGADVRIHPMTPRETKDGGQVIDAGPAPVVDIQLLPGSYLVVGSLPGFRDTHLPVVLETDRRHNVLLTLKPWSADIPLIGRTHHVAALTETLSHCVSERRLISTTVFGDAGAGKGKVLEAFDEHVDSLPEVYSFSFVHCTSLHRRIPFEAVAEVIRHRAGIAPHASHETVFKQLVHATERAYSRNGRVPLGRKARRQSRDVASTLATIPGLCGRDSKWSSTLPEGPEGTLMVYEAASALFGEIAETNPLVIVIQGSDGLDRVSRDCLLYLASSLRAHPIFFLAFAREDSIDLRTDRTQRLEPLGRDDIRHQLSVMLKAPATTKLVDFIHSRTGGNVYQVLEFTRFLYTHGHLQHTGRAADLGTNDEALTEFAELPIDTILLKGVDELDPTTREVLEAAVTSGDRTWHEGLAHALEREVTEDIQTLVDLEFLVPQPGSRFLDTRAYAHRHPRMRELIYDSLTTDRRQELHGRIARWVQTVSQARLTDHAMLARHLIRAGEEAAAHITALEQEARRWEREDAPPWLAWPENTRSGVLPEPLESP